MEYVILPVEKVLCILVIYLRYDVECFALDYFLLFLLFVLFLKVLSNLKYLSHFLIKKGRIRVYLN